jgi:hypothetical protein
MPTAAAVNDLVFEPMANSVRGVTESGFPSSFRPNPLAYTTESFLTIAIERPAMFHSSIAFRM